MPFKFNFGPKKNWAYDLQGRLSSGQLAEVAAEVNSSGVFGGGGDESSIKGISIAPHEQYSYIPNMDTTKSLATDIIQLTRFKNRRPTIQDDRPIRKPSFRNIFLGVPEPERRRFSEDIRGANLAAKAQALESKETKRVLILQVFIPFLLSGFGNVGAGLFLNYAQTWKVFRENTIFYMLLATVMAFKTNLEATLAARLSTCSNMGSMKTIGKKFEAFLGNLAMVQTQSIIFGLMSATFVVIISTLEQSTVAVAASAAAAAASPSAVESNLTTTDSFPAVMVEQDYLGVKFVELFNLNLSLRVIATAMAAICINELLSSCLILLVVIASERANVNPDNVSTLIAAMFGDFSSVFFISITASIFHTFQTLNWLFLLVILGLLFLLPITIYLTSKNSFTKGMFLGTHLPLAMAVTVATISGLVFDHAVQSFARIAIYQAVVNGISVNLMAVQASRISTYLQQLNAVAPDRAKSYASNYSPIKALYAQDMNASVARWLIAMCIPAMSVYLCFIFLVSPSYVDVTFHLISCCLIAIVTQVTFIQCLTYLVTPISWKLDWDPDNVVIPVLMSISDCSGNAILLTAFIFLKYMEDPNSVGQQQILD